MQALMKNPEETLQAVEGMTPVKKTKEKVEAEEQQESPDAVEEKKQFEGQLTQLEAMFTLDKVKTELHRLTKLFSSSISFRSIYILIKRQVIQTSMNHSYA